MVATTLRLSMKARKSACWMPLGTRSGAQARLKASARPGLVCGMAMGREIGASCDGTWP